MVFVLNDKEYPFFRTTFTQNVYQINEELFPPNKHRYEVDMNKNIFKAFILIIRWGNADAQKKDQPKKKTYGEIIDKKIREDAAFVNEMKRIFAVNSFLEIVKDFNLNFVNLGSMKADELIVSYKIEQPYDGAVERFTTKDVKVLANPNNATTGFFLSYNGHLEFKLAELIRTNKVYIRPFVGDTYNFSPTNGNTYSQVYVSLDGQNWDYMNFVPSSYGTNYNNYITEVSFTDIVSFQYIKFSSTASGLFSLSYLSFTKQQQPQQQKKK